MIKNFKDKIHQERFFACIVCVATIFVLLYQSESTANVPFMDYWKYMAKLVDKMYTQGVSFWDIYGNNGVHRTPVQLLLFLINVKFFHYDPQIEIFLGGISMAVLSCIIYKAYKQEMFYSEKRLPFYLGVLGFVVIIFNLNQWEIIASEFILAFELRFIAFVLSFLWTNELLKKLNECAEYAVELAFFYILVICGLSGMYFLAYGCSLAVIIIWDFVRRDKEDKKKYFLTYMILGVGLLIGGFLYLYGLDFSSTNSVDATIGLRLVMDFLKAIVLMAGTIVAGTGQEQTVVISWGIVISVIHIVSMFIYFKRKMYKTTYVPMFFSIYALAVMLVIFIGRSGSASGLEYLISSRYVMDTLWLLIADVWILTNYMAFCLRDSSVNNIKYGVVIVLILSIWIGILCSNQDEWEIKSYRKQYFADITNKMLQIDSVTDQDLVSCQAEPVVVKEAVSIMKKYGIGIFYHIKKE